MQRVLLRLGFLNGVLLGFGLAAGVWVLDVIHLGREPVLWLYPTLALGVGALTLIGGAGGWLTSRLDSPLAGALVGLLMAVLATWVIVHLPFEGRTWIVWLSDRRFWGLPVYSVPDGLENVLAGFFPALLFVLLGVFQPYRLEGVLSALTPDYRLTLRAAVMLAWPMGLAIVAGVITDDLANERLRAPVQTVAEAIRTVQTYDGDLFALSRERGVNYNALAGVRERMSARYAIQSGEINSQNDLVLVAAHFDNGAWIYCQLLAFNLTHCYDASPSYTRGFAAALTGDSPGDCPECSLRIAPKADAWLQSRRARLAGQPAITFLAQAGRYVWMRAASPDGRYAVECLFRGLRPVTLEECIER